ncbi:DUF4381 domain-containing protein [Hahella ganghwensis]|uniref:DUF4381 domain-containing protein n=1 Tax=Hahella ganghwensis TaxID=286420 RepID=UPI00035C960A|nr:DUF4381 domain-containing protein [Hahella ganghwensis]
MSIVQQLQLNDVIEPSPISAWPPAPGWWLLLVLALLMLALGIYWLIRLRRHRTYRRRALTALEKCWQVHSAREDYPGFRHAANLVLKRHCLQLGYTHTASMPAESWQKFLMKKLPPRYHSEVSSFCHLLYRPVETTQQEARDQYVKLQDWIRRLKC